MSKSNTVVIPDVRLVILGSRDSGYALVADGKQEYPPKSPGRNGAPKLQDVVDYATKTYPGVTVDMDVRK